MNSPKLRFKNFNDEWKTFKIQDTFVFLSTNSLSRDSLNYNNGTIQNIHYGDIHTILPTICNVNKERLPYINYNAIYKNTNFMQENDLLIADASENYDDIGKSIEVIELGNRKIVGGLHTLLLRCELNLFAPKFKGYLFNTNNIRTQIKILSVGAKVLGISKDNLKKITFYLPSLEEQTKIANFLSLIDRKIEIQEKLVENLKLYKKGLLQKIFSNNQGWKSAKLGDFLIEYNKKTTINNQYPVLTSSRKGLFLQYDYFDKQIASDNNIGYNILPCNYITYRNASDDATFYFNINNIVKYGIVSPLYPVFTTQNMNVIFLQLILNYSNDFKKYCLEEQQGGTRTSMSITKLKEFKVKYPSIEEQNRIANLFSNLDKKMDFETNRLTKLKEYKKGLLQQMFI